LLKTSIDDTVAELYVIAESINYSLETIPDELKIAKVIPLYKTSAIN